MKHFLGAAFAVVLTAALMAPNTARSAVIINVEETSGNVTIDLSGTLDIAGATPAGQSVFAASFSPTSSVNDLMLVTGTNTVELYSGLSGPPTLGGGTPVFVITSSASTSFWLAPALNQIGVPAGYASGDPLNATLTFSGQSFMSFGLTAGDQFVWTLPSMDTITMNIIPASVPAPAGLPLALAGLGAVALIRRQRKHTV